MKEPSTMPLLTLSEIDITSSSALFFPLPFLLAVSPLMERMEERV
jgi:hypothetical protein